MFEKDPAKDHWQEGLKLSDWLYWRFNQVKGLTTMPAVFVVPLSTESLKVPPLALVASGASTGIITSPSSLSLNEGPVRTRAGAQSRSRNRFGGCMEAAVGISEEQLRRAARSAVCKINIDSDGRLAMTAVLRKIFAEAPGEFDPRKYLAPARAAQIEIVRERIRFFGASGKVQ